MSASLEPTSRTEAAAAVPRTRASTRPAGLVIGLVAVLAAGIGLAAGSFLLTTRTAGVGGAASYVPATAAFYVEMRLQPSEAQDAALRDVLGRFPTIDGVDLDRPLYDQLGDVLDEALAGEGAGVTWSEDVATWFDGRLAFALIEMPASAFDPMGFDAMGFDPTATPETPPMVIMAGVTDAEAARTSFARIVAETASVPTTFTTTEHRGVTIQVNEEREEGAWAVTDDQLLLAPTVDDIIAALDTRADGVTMADDETTTAFAAGLADDWLAFGIYDFTATLAAALEAGAPSSGSTAVASLLEHQPLRGAFAIAATDEGLAVDAVTEAPTGPFAATNSERGLASEVPGDALYFAEGGNLGPALAAFVTSLKEGLSTEPEAVEGIRTAEAALGADLEDLVAWIGDGALAIGWDGSEPYGGLVLVPEDRSAAERRLSQLATFARLATMDPSSGISVEEREVRGVVLTAIRWTDAGGMLIPSAEPASLVIEYALTEDHVVVGFGDRFVPRALELDESASLGATERYAAAVRGLGGPEGTSIGWLDLAGMLGAVEQALADDLDDPDYRSDIRPWLLPFDHLVGVSRLEDGLHVQRTVLVLR